MSKRCKVCRILKIENNGLTVSSDESRLVIFTLVPFFSLVQTGVVKTGGFRYDDGTRYIGDWNQKGQKHGMGHLLLSGLLIKIFFHNSRNKIS